MEERVCGVLFLMNRGFCHLAIAMKATVGCDGAASIFVRQKLR